MATEIAESPICDPGQQAMQYAAKGWRVVPLHERLPDGSCSCNRKDACPMQSRGKHPRIHEWQKRASADEDQVAEWFDRWPTANVGLQLGKASGLIDIEYDDAEGKSTAERLLRECHTPTYRSARSVHRLFKWNNDLPNDTVIKVAGLELRLGGGKGAQSVVPPSVHHTGTRYEWLPGLSFDEVELADVPDSILKLLWNENDGLHINGEPRSSEHWQKILSGSAEGSRNSDMASWVGLNLRNAIDIEGQTELKNLYEMALLLNERNNPPMPENEVKTIFMSILRKEQARRLAESSTTIIPKGVDDTIDQPKNTDPGDFHLVRVESDPPAFELHHPAFKAARGGFILLDAEQLVSWPVIVVQANKQAKVGLSPAFAKRWNGDAGYYVKLIRNQTYREAPAEMKRDAVVAGRILELLHKARTLRDGEKPGESGRLCKTQDGDYEFAFNQIQDEFRFSSDKIIRNELSRMLERVGAFKFGKHKFYRVPPQAHQRLLAISNGDTTEY